MDAEIRYLSYTHRQKAKLAIPVPCTCTVYCTTVLRTQVAFNASGSEVNIFACC